MKTVELGKPKVVQQINQVTISRLDTEQNLLKTDPGYNQMIYTEPDVSPEAEEQIVIINMVKGNSGFLRKSYNEKILGEIIDEEDFIVIIDKATKIVEFLYSKKRTSDNKGISKYKVFLSVLSMLIIIIFFFIFYFSILHENMEYEYVSYGLITAGFGIFSILTAYEALRNSKQSVFKYKDVMNEELNEFFNKENDFYGERGLIWSFNNVKMHLEAIVNPIVKQQYIIMKKRKAAARAQMSTNSKQSTYRSGPVSFSNSAKKVNLDLTSNDNERYKTQIN